jgi:hypothetical protein
MHHDKEFSNLWRNRGKENVRREEKVADVMEEQVSINRVVCLRRCNSLRLVGGSR